MTNIHLNININYKYEYRLDVAEQSVDNILRQWYWESLHCPVPSVSTAFNASLWEFIHDGLLFTNANHGNRWQQAKNQ